ncbi:MAG: hypothetical protein QM811_24875 [Pirellulales bacterium]
MASRVGDLPLLAQAIVERDNARSERQLRGLAPDALELLAVHRWPGDAAELEQTLRAARETAAGPEIVARDLPPLLRHAEQAALHPRVAPRPLDLTALLDDVERRASNRRYAPRAATKRPPRRWSVGAARGSIVAWSNWDLRRHRRRNLR